MANLVGKVLGGIVQAPGAVVGFAGATAVGAVGGVVKGTGKGLVSGAKAANAMQKKILGETAEAATKSVSKAGPPNYAYRSRVQDGTEIFERQPLGVSKRKQKWESISNKEYAEARRRNGTSAAEFSDRLLPAPMEVAEEAAESGAGFWSGVKEWADDNTLLAAGIAGGVGIAGGALLFGDDD